MSRYVPVPMQCECCKVSKAPSSGRGNLVQVRLNGRTYRGFRSVGKAVGLPPKTTKSRMLSGTCLRQPIRVTKPRQSPEPEPVFALGWYSLRFQRVMAESFR